MASFFSENDLKSLAQQLNKDDQFVQESKFATMSIGFQTDTGSSSWVRFEQGKIVETGISSLQPDFILVGQNEAWSALATTMPLNRLVRRGEIKITGNVRTCLKNWKMVWLIGQKLKEIGG
jgi:hypothetical protein